MPTRKPWVAVPSPWFSTLSEDGVWGEAKEQHFVPGIFAVDKRSYPDFYEQAKEYILSHDLNAQHGEIDSICSIVGNDFFSSASGVPVLYLLRDG